jgi:hypothetical protein
MGSAIPIVGSVIIGLAIGWWIGYRHGTWVVFEMMRRTGKTPSQIKAFLGLSENDRS